jgi:hypothetical protein
MGERRALRALRRLPDSYVAVTNFSVERDKSGDTDILLFGLQGVMTLEVKSYSGTVLYENGRWWRVLKNGRRRPLKSVSHQARAQSRQIREIIMQIKESDADMPWEYIPVLPVIVFVGTDRLNLIQLDIPAVKDWELTDYVQKQPERLNQSQVFGLLKAFLKRYAA